MSSKIGIFGGNFDPVHFGHINSMRTVKERLELDKIRAVPAAISPLRIQTQGSNPEHRLNMLRLAIGDEADWQIDTRELDRGGMSFTIDTVNSLLKENDDQLFLIIGLDQFLKFDQWKDFEKLLDKVDLVVTSRPGHELPLPKSEWPSGVSQLVVDTDGQQAMLKSGRTIHFIQLEDVEVSATEVRKKVRLGQSLQTEVPPPVARYIQEHHLYESVDKQIGDFAKFAEFCAGVLRDHGGINVQSYELADRSAPCEFALIASGTSTRHTSALAEHVVTEVKKTFGVWPQHLEGQQEGRWVVADYGALIVHVFYDYVRQEYRLEELWTRPKS
ncbi:MAG: nicotinate (nicotinamide) nucleotide adenylyltransferase [Bdellovibrionales bacterium]